MKRRFLTAILVLSLIFAASAQGTRGGGGGAAGGAGEGGGAGGRADSAQAGGSRASAGVGSGDMDRDMVRDMDRLHLQTQECDRIRDMLKDGEGEFLQIRAELREMQARMTRLMLQKRVDRPEIERTLRRSSELEFRMRMIQAERHIRIKEMLGAERWAALYRLAQRTREAENTGQIDDLLSKTQDPAQAQALLQIFKELY